MSDWLERELARGLAPVTAPESLGVRLGFERAKRSEFPRVALAVAAAVVLIIGAGYAASRTAALDLRREARVNVALQPLDDLQLAAARPLRCDGGAAAPAPVNSARATVILAHYSVEPPAHPAPAASDAGCRFCHQPAI
jgi:hypothetical protein